MNTCPRCRRTYEDGVRFCPSDGSLVAAMPGSSGPVDPYLGRMLMGQFHLVALAGRGAMGTVYRAEQAKMDRTVAVKVLRGDLLKDETAIKRFLREARAAARLNHPNIVTVHVVGETDEGVPFIVMEYVEGRTLGALVERERVLPVRRALRIARQIASALVEAHGLGIVHRDLKADNILLAEKRHEHDMVKVLDFGIAKLLAGPDASAGEIAVLTRDGTIFGTPHYIAPEQAAGREVDGRADLYSLGVILFRMVTGRLPFDGTSGMQVLMRHLKEAPPRPRAIRPELPEPVQALILTALEKDREHRFPDAERFIAALESVEKAVEASAPTGGAAAPGSPASATVVTAPRVDAMDASRTLMGVPLPPRGDGRDTQPTAVTPIATPVSRPAVEIAPAPPPQATAPLDDPSRTRAGEQGLDAWSSGADEAVRRAGELEPEFGTMSGEVPAPRELDEDYPESYLARRRRRMRWAGIGAAVLLAGGGAWAALRSHGDGAEVVAATKSAAAAAPANRAPAPAGTAPVTGSAVPLVEEHVAVSGGYAVRLGFDRRPEAGGLSTLHVFLDDGKGGQVTGANLEVSVRGGGEHEEHTPLHAEAGAPGYVAEVAFGSAGRHHLRVGVEAPGGKRFATTFDLDVAAASAPAAHPTAETAPRPDSPAHAMPHPHRERTTAAAERADDPGSLPVTVIPAGSSGGSGSDVVPHAIGPAPGASAPRSVGVAPSGLPQPTPAPASPDPYQLLDTSKPERGPN